MHTMNRTLESYIIYLTEDLKIADTCKSIKNGLLKGITDKNHFSEEMAKYFTKEYPNTPFSINETDPTQVALLKKLINALEHAERAFRQIENLDINRERWTVEIMADAARIGYDAVHEIYAALQLINHSNAEIQEIVGPYIQKLLPQMALASKAIDQFKPTHPEESMGAGLGSLVSMLPTEKMTEKQSIENISKVIFQLSHYFEELQKKLDIDSPEVATPKVTAARQEQVHKKAEETIQLLGKYNPILRYKRSRLSSYIELLETVIKQSSTILQMGVPITRKAYLDAAHILDDLKHNVIPNLISELEAVEESMGIKHGHLTQPVLEQMNQYYSQLYTTVFQQIPESIAKLPNLDVMMDDAFIDKRRDYQESRLSEVQLEYNDINNNTLKAATLFFERIASYGSIVQIGNKWSLVNINDNEKDYLAAQYKQFQSYFAAQFPDMDQLIVDALQKREENTYVSQIWNADYKQLVGGNQFKKILGCKEKVLTSIHQTAAQSQFKARLIEGTMSHTEQSTYESHQKKNQLNPLVAPFQPLKFVDEKDSLPAVYHERAILVSNQIMVLERAKEGLAEFFEYFKKIYLDDKSISFSPLDETDKEYLRKTYKKFQSQLVQGHPEINFSLVNSLNSSTPTSPSVLISDLMSIETSITKRIDLLIKDKENYIKQEQEARQKLYADRSLPLVSKKAELQEQTLFGQLNKYKLSEKIDHFFTDKFQAYLKNNLSEVVWHQLSTKDGQLIDKEKIPFLEFHKDSPEVAMYKQLINSIYYMQKGFTQLESLNDYGDSSDIVNRSRFIMTVFNALIMNITYSKYYIAQASDNPALKAILEEGLELLAPLRNQPIIGDYLKPSQKQEAPKQDIVNAWKVQQEIVRSGLSSIIMPKPKPEAKLVIEDKPQKSIEINYSQLLAEALYKIPAALKDQSKAPQQEEIDRNIKIFVKGLNGISYSPKLVKRVLGALSKLQIQLSDIEQSGREFTMSHLREIKSEIGTVLMEAADNAEFHLGLKPGIYSSIVSERFDQFYESLATHLPLENAQTALEMVIDATSIQKRLAKEMERLNELRSDQSTHDTEKSIFGTNYEQYTQLHQCYLRMKELVKVIENVEDSSESTLEEHLLEAFASEYEKIQPKLAEIDPKFTKDYIISCKDKSSVICAIKEIFAAQQQVNKPALGKLLDLLYLNGDFNHEENKEKFLRCYEELQPYLLKVDYRYDVVYFIRELQTAEDFRAATEKTIEDSGKLQEMIDGLKHSKHLKIELCSERIRYFNDLQNEHLKKIAPEKINEYKERVFNECLRNRLKSAIDPHDDLFLEHFHSSILQERAKILKNITIKDDIKEKIATAIDVLYSKRVDKNDGAFNILHFVNVPLNNIHRLIEKEEKKSKETPDRDNIIELLKLRRDNLMIIQGISADNIIGDLKDQHIQVKEKIGKMNDYDKMIHVYDLLNEMEEYISEDKRNTPAIKQEKAQEIYKMKHILLNNDTDLSQCLSQVKNHVFSSECEKVLRKNSDGFFTSLFNKLRESLTKWESMEKQKITFFKERFLEITRDREFTDLTISPRNP